MEDSISGQNTAEAAGKSSPLPARFHIPEYLCPHYTNPHNSPRINYSYSARQEYRHSHPQSDICHAYDN